MIILLLFTQVMNALVSSNTNLGKKLPKNDATITSKNDDATVKVKPPSLSEKSVQVENFKRFHILYVTYSIYSLSKI